MELRLKVSTIKAAVKAFGTKDADQLGTTAWRSRSLSPDDTLLVNLDQIEPENLVKLQAIMKDNKEPANRGIALMLKAVDDPDNKSVPDLSKFPSIFKAWLVAHGEPWLYSTNARQRGAAYAVAECRYVVPARSYRDEPYVQIELTYNTKMENRDWTLTLHRRDVVGNTVEAIMRRHGLSLPDEELEERYHRLYERYVDYGGQQAEQFWIRGTANKVASGRYEWWGSEPMNMMAKGRPTKAVLDLGSMQDRSDHTKAREHSTIFGKKIPVPTHPVLPVFSLLHHETAWVNVADMSPYVYEEGLGDRLILPASHRKLIGALVSNLEVLKMESEVEGKSRAIRAKASSNVILAMGRAGTGKTLTAEVYAEEIKRPLYEVNSGQLGTDSETIETELHRILERSVRLRMPLLINEADVFIQTRGASLEQNAVVSVFLRALEYHNGLVFMTTNRPEDVDEAIKSRCISEITYLAPKAPERAKLWLSLLGEFNQQLAKAEMKQVVDAFPDVTGRDIQNLIRLTSRYCTATKEEFCLQALIDCAAFKSILVAPEFMPKEEA